MNPKKTSTKTVDANNANFKSFQDLILARSAKSKKAVSQKLSVPTTNVIKTKIPKPKVIIPSEPESYFVYLKNPLEYRRHLLESSRKTLYCLKNHNNLILIREKKLEEIKKFKASVRELIFLNKKFNDKLPKYASTSLGSGFGSNIKPVMEKPVVQKTVTVKKPIQQKRSMTEIDRLEESLANIEKKAT